MQRTGADWWGRDGLGSAGQDETWIELLQSIKRHNRTGHGELGLGKFWDSADRHGKPRQGNSMPKSRQPREIWRGITRPKVWKRDSGICQSPLNPPICQGKQGELKLKTCHIDHIRSGKLATNELSNLRVLCRPCHVLRADMRHRGMIAGALRDGIVPVNWREYVWFE